MRTLKECFHVRRVWLAVFKVWAAGPTEYYMTWAAFGWAMLSSWEGVPAFEYCNLGGRANGVRWSCAALAS